MKKFRLFLMIAVISGLIIGCGGNPFGVDDDLLPISQIRPMEDQLFNLLNSARADEGLSALAHHAELRLVAREHSEDMYRRDFFDHTNPDGQTPQDRVENAGISIITGAENIAMNTGHTDPVQEAHTGLMNSPGHYANIMNSTFNTVGVGIAGDGDKFYFTQVFARISQPAMLYFSTTIQNIERNPWPNISETFGEAWRRGELGVGF